MAKKKTIDTLVEDMENVFSQVAQGHKLDFPQEMVDKLMKGLEEVLHHWATPQPRGTGLRMSNVGKPSRQLWFDVNSERPKEELSPSVMFRFLYGHVLEEFLLFFAEFAGHKVTHQQAEVNVHGIKGHIDSVIDGVVIDVKSASDYGFKKFKGGRLAEDDPFGYLAQIAGYEYGMKRKGGGFLVANKSTGELCLYRPDDLELPNIKTHIDTTRIQLDNASPPERCHPIIDDGKKGNQGLHRGCTWCDHKIECNPTLRVFKYAYGNKYLTKVVDKPRVDEITEEYINERS